MLAPRTVLLFDYISNMRYLLKDFTLQVESVTFGDGSYRAMVDQRMATRDPVMAPFYNLTGFESSTQVSNINQQFTIGTESLNAIIATIRPGNYDAQVIATGSSIGGSPQTSGIAVSNANWYKPQQGSSNPRGTRTPMILPENSAYGWYYAFLSGEKPIADIFGTYGRFSANVNYHLIPSCVHSTWLMCRMLGICCTTCLMQMLLR